MKNLNFKQKVALIAISAVVAIAAIYTASWYIIKHNIESSIHQEVANLTSQPSIKSVNYKLETSCFPYICVKLSDLNVKTKKYFAISKEGFEFNIFAKHPLKFKIKNIFASNINQELTQLKYDVTSINLDNNQNVTFTTDINKLNINVSKNSFKTVANGVFVEVSSNLSAAKALIDAQELKLDYKQSTDDKTTNRDLALETFNLNIFDVKTNKKAETIYHAKADLSLNNLDKLFLQRAKNKESKEYVKKAIENFKDLKTTVKVNDLKFTSTQAQILGHAQLFIDQQYFLNANGDIAIRFVKKNDNFEQLLQNYGFYKNEKDSFIVNVRTDKNIIKVNKNIAIPAPFFKPE
jgi:hypothetical protein